MNTTPRLRIFAGPNGSGKSTIKEVIAPALLGIYVNPDEIEKALNEYGLLDFSPYQVAIEPNEIIAFFTASPLLAKAHLLSGLTKISSVGNTLYFPATEVNSYWASVIADFIRQKLLENGISFTFETVMSSPDKVDFLRKAQTKGFRTYLYYVATEDPEINISRVQYRVKCGGHSVPRDKITSRYHRSLDLLLDAINSSNRAYLFDNSGTEHVWVAEITDGIELDVKTDEVPHWFKSAIWDKLALDESNLN